MTDTDLLEGDAASSARGGSLDTPRRVRMSDAEAIMWAVEKDPALRSDFCNLTVLGAAPDAARLRAKVRVAIDTIERLGQRVVSAPLRLAPPEWVDDPSLDLDYHVRRVSVSAKRGNAPTDRELLDLCAQLAETPFDRGRPLWEFTVIDGLADGRVAMLQKVHHTITDGVGGLKLSLALVDFEADSQVPERPERARSATAPNNSPIQVTRDALVDATNRGIDTARATVGAAARLATHPFDLPGAIGDAARVAGSVRRQVLVTDAAHSDVMTMRSLRRHFEWLDLALDDVRSTASALGGSVNDVFVTAVAGALGDYHEARGSKVDDLRMAMPVSTRERGDAGANRFAPMRIVVPIRPADPRARFAATSEALRTAKAERALDTIDRLAGLVSGLPTSILVNFTRSQTRTIDFATSNLRGSPVELFLAGAPILGNYAFGPRTGCAVNVTMMSYLGRVQLGVNLDPAAIDSPSDFMAALERSFAALFAAA